SCAFSPDPNAAALGKLSASADPRTVVVSKMPVDVARAVELATAFPIAFAEAMPRAASPTAASELFVDDASPDVTDESIDELRALMAVAPAETAPMTCPPTASPVDAGAACDSVARLSPTWSLLAMPNASASEAFDAVTESIELNDVAVHVKHATPAKLLPIALPAEVASMAPTAASPTNSVELFVDVASPLFASTPSDVFAAMIRVPAPADVTAPITSPPTPPA